MLTDSQKSPSHKRKEEETEILKLWMCLSVTESTRRKEDSIYVIILTCSHCPGSANVATHAPGLPFSSTV